MFPIFRTIYRHVRSPLVVRNAPVFQDVSISRLFHTLNKIQGLNFLNPNNVSLLPSCGLKFKGNLKRRCKDCYFVSREDRLYVMCHSHGRHKQAQFKKDEKNTWMLSHATQHKYRPW